MAVNPQLVQVYGGPIPMPFIGELFVLQRDGVEFEVDKMPMSSNGKVKAKGTIFLSNVRMVFVASQPLGSFQSFDMPLLFVHGEKFNQPVFFCNNIAGQVEPVVPEGENRALYSTHSFKILFKEGGCGTFIPLFFSLIRAVRQYNQYAAYTGGSDAAPRADPLNAAQTPVDEMMRTAYVDPSDPTRIFLQQPATGSELRRRNYNPQPVEASM